MKSMNSEELFNSTSGIEQQHKKCTYWFRSDKFTLFVTALGFTLAFQACLECCAIADTFNMISALYSSNHTVVWLGKYKCKQTSQSPRPILLHLSVTNTIHVVHHIKARDQNNCSRKIAIREKPFLLKQTQSFIPW